MRQGDDHGRRVVEDEVERCFDDSQRHQAGVDDAVEAEHHLPGKDSKQVAGPEWDGDQNQPDQLIRLHLEGDEVGRRIGQQDGRQGYRAGDLDRLQQQLEVDRLLEENNIVVEAETAVEVEINLGPETERYQDRERDRQGDEHPGHGRRQQRVAAKRFVTHTRRTDAGNQSKTRCLQPRWRHFGTLNHLRAP